MERYRFRDQSWKWWVSILSVVALIVAAGPVAAWFLPAWFLPESSFRSKATLMTIVVFTGVCFVMAVIHSVIDWWRGR